MMQATSRSRVVIAGFLVALSIAAGGCQDEIDVTEYYLEAIRNPAGFDAWLSRKDVDPRAAGCLSDYVHVALQRRDQALLECDNIFGSVGDHFNACADERADPYETAAAMLQDIGRAVDGKVRFSQTATYSILVFMRAEMGVTDYNRFLVGPAERVVEAGGRFKCRV